MVRNVGFVTLNNHEKVQYQNSNIQSSKVVSMVNALMCQTDRMTDRQADKNNLTRIFDPGCIKMFCMCVAYFKSYD